MSSSGNNHSDDQKHSPHADHQQRSHTSMAISATLHCLVGCSIGEILGLTIGSIIGLSRGSNIALAFVLSFVFGYLLSTIPLIKSGLTIRQALPIILLADTLSILTMEIVDNTVMALIPNAMNASLVNPVYWIAMPISLFMAFLAAVPVNRYLLSRGQGHALVHKYHN